jgi:hypothetical protein
MLDVGNFYEIDQQNPIYMAQTRHQAESMTEESLKPYSATIFLYRELVTYFSISFSGF